MSTYVHVYICRSTLSFFNEHILFHCITIIFSNSKLCNSKHPCKNTWGHLYEGLFSVYIFDSFLCFLPTICHPSSSNSLIPPESLVLFPLSSPQDHFFIIIMICKSPNWSPYFQSKYENICKAMCSSLTRIFLLPFEISIILWKFVY